MRKLITFALSILISTICLAGDPKPSESEYVRDLGGGFLVEGGKLKYGMTFNISDELQRPLFAVVQYQNPKNRKEPLISVFSLESGSELVTQSEEFESAKYRKTYKIVLELYSDEEHTQLLASHKSKVKFNLPPALAKKMGIKLL